jgi:hypothetical protein
MVTICCVSFTRQGKEGIDRIRQILAVRMRRRKKAEREE